MNQILTQVGYYAAVMFLTVFVIGFFQKGYFWKFLKVRMSFGSLILVKVREMTHDWYALGKVKESMIEYKYHKEYKTIALPKDRQVFYRTLGLSMIDIDAQTNNVCSVDYEAVPGFDAIKHKDLHTRALFKPHIKRNQEIIMIFMLIAIILGIFAIGVLVYNSSKDIKLIKIAVDNIHIPASAVL